jgi:hypothetical protein
VRFVKGAVVGGGDLAGQVSDVGALDDIELTVASVGLPGGAALFPRRLESDRISLTSVERYGQFVHPVHSVSTPASRGDVSANAALANHASTTPLPGRIEQHRRLDPAHDRLRRGQLGYVVGRPLTQASEPASAPVMTPGNFAAGDAETLVALLVVGPRAQKTWT